MKKRILIVDDEPLARSLLIKYIRDLELEVEIVEAENGFDAFKAIQELQPDLVLLDVQMPKLTAIEMIELLDDYLPPIIFITAYDHYAIKAFEVNAIDYILKPVEKVRFNKAIERWNLGYIHRHDSLNKLEIQKNNSNRIAVKHDGKIKIIPDFQILMIEAADDYVKLYTHDGVFMKKCTLGSLEEKLSSQLFFKAHRSYLVSVSEVDSLESTKKDSYEVKLKSGFRVPLSRTGLQNFKSIFN